MTDFLRKHLLAMCIDAGAPASLMRRAEAFLDKWEPKIASTLASQPDSEPIAHYRQMFLRIMKAAGDDVSGIDHPDQITQPDISDAALEAVESLHADYIEALGSEPGTIAALRSALEAASEYVAEMGDRTLLSRIDRALTASSEPARIEREKIEAEERERVLALVYSEGLYAKPVSAQLAVARICDEVLDRSGGLLGRVRDKARNLLHSDTESQP